MTNALFSHYDQYSIFVHVAYNRPTSLVAMVALPLVVVVQTVPLLVTYPENSVFFLLGVCGKM